MSASALKHIEHLANTIGPRGSATEKEKQGHAYAHQTLADLGCEPRTETFEAGTSPYAPYIVALSLMLLAAGIFYAFGTTANPQTGALAALALGLIVSASVALELHLNDNPLRWFVDTAPSQNVIGFTRARAEAHRTVVVLAHVDSHRTPLFWRSRDTYTGYRMLVTAALVSVAVLDVLFLIGLFTPTPVVQTWALIPAALIALALALVVQAHLSPYTVGANDNASGVGIVLALAEKFQREPLENTEVWWAITGCEEVGAYGSLDLARKYGAQFATGAAIVVDNVAGKNTALAYLTSEGIAYPEPYPPAGLALAAQVAEAHPELDARAGTQPGAYTDGYGFLRAGIPTVSLIAFTRRGWIPDWHNASDVFANIDAEAVERAEQFIEHLVRHSAPQK